MRKTYNPLNAIYSDRFIVLDRKYFDKSGWENNNLIYTNFNTVEEQIRYIFINQSSAQLINKQQEVDVDDNNSSSDDEYNNEAEDSEIEN